MIARAVVVAALALALASPALAGPAEDCDLLAAAPQDPQGNGAGVRFDAIDGAEAEKACRAAVADAPDIARYKFQLGRALDRLGKYEEAKEAYLAAYKAGSASAANAYAKLLELGLGGKVDYAGAAEYYQRSIDAGLPLSAGDLGYLHEAGKGFAVDPARAAKLYQVAVDSGDAWAMVQLGLLTENGTGVANDYAKAAKLYRGAADQGDQWGEHNIGVMYEWGRGVPQNYAEAARWYRRAANQENISAIRALATFHAEGMGVKRDDAEAERLMRQAISLGGDEVYRAKNQLAFFLGERNRGLDEAATLAEAAIAAVPAGEVDAANFQDTLALVRNRQGRFDEALKLQLEAMKHLSKHAPAHERLGDFYAALGRKAEARAAWQKALALPAPGPEQGVFGWDRAAVTRKLAGGCSSPSAC